MSAIPVGRGPRYQRRAPGSQRDRPRSVHESVCPSGAGPATLIRYAQIVCDQGREGGRLIWHWHERPTEGERVLAGSQCDQRPVSVRREFTVVGRRSAKMLPSTRWNALGPTTAPCPVHLHDGPVVLDRRRWRDSSDDSNDCHVAESYPRSQRPGGPAPSIRHERTLRVWPHDPVLAPQLCTRGIWTGEG